jgi:hypothetical protein
MRKRRTTLQPLLGTHRLSEIEVYPPLTAKVLGVNVRRQRRPDSAWLGSYRKCQLAHLLADLRGQVHSTPSDVTGLTIE